jgi:hypothetical protein
MQETQMYETELKEANEYISTLFAWLKELEAKCAEETQLKEGKCNTQFCKNKNFVQIGAHIKL